MKDTITQQLDDKDITYANVLVKTGYKFCQAKIIIALIAGEKTQMELIKCINENQSAISAAVRNLANEHLINISEQEQTTGRGRPKQIYSLKSFEGIVDAAERKIIRECERQTLEINNLKELQKTITDEQ